MWLSNSPNYDEVTRWYVHVHECKIVCIHNCNQLPWQLGFTPTISRGMGGAMVQIINQTGSANPLQVSCTKVSQVYSQLCCFVDHEKLCYNYNMCVYVRTLVHTCNMHLYNNNLLKR